MRATVQIKHLDIDVETLMLKIPTPERLEDLRSERYQRDELHEIDSSFLEFASRHGQIYGYAQEQGGAAIQNLFPIKRDEGEQISSSSRVMLEMHTETAFHPWRSQTLCLLCVRDDPRAGTVHAQLDNILGELDDTVIDLLHLPIYLTSLDASFRVMEQSDAVVRTAVLFNNGDKMTYDRALMRGSSTESQRALDAFSKAVDKCRNTIYLKIGDILVIDNQRVIHGRTPFSPRYDGTDRWLKRAMTSRVPVPAGEIVSGVGGAPVISTKF